MGCYFMNKENQDSLQRFIVENAPVRGELIHLHASYQDIVNQHAYAPPIRLLLGEALCVAGLLTAMIKFTGRITVQFQGNGKLKLLLAQCNNLFHMRGLVKAEEIESYADLMESFSDGILMITIDSGPGKRHQGIVSWSGTSLAESIEGYFRDSEQLITKIELAVNETSATGLLLQMIPDTNNIEIPVDETNHLLQWEYLSKMTKNLSADEMFQTNNESLLKQLCPEEEIRVFPAVPVKFACTCSRKHGENAILMLGQNEAEAELKDKQCIVVTCDFCNKEHIFDHHEVATIFKKNDKPSLVTH